MNFYVSAGKWDDDGENCKFSSYPEDFGEAIEMLLDVNTYPWARIEVLTAHGEWHVTTLLWSADMDTYEQHIPDFSTEDTDDKNYVFTINNQRYVAYWVATEGVKHAFSL